MQWVNVGCGSWMCGHFSLASHKAQTGLDAALIRRPQIEPANAAGALDVKLSIDENKQVNFVEYIPG